MREPRAPTSKGAGSDGDQKVTPEIAAEAAVWIARLHSPNRDRQMEQEFRAWQASSAARREAFEAFTDVWQDVGRISVADALRAASAARAAANAAEAHRRGGRWPWLQAGLAGGALVIAVALALKWYGAGSYSTDVGEQRLVVLEEGSRVLLNTSTRLHVTLGTAQRTVDVDSGEALFEVAKDPHRPFVVRVAGSEVVAVGTAFSVRYPVEGSRRADELVVTLIEGQVNVRPAEDKPVSALAPEHPVAMKAGDRLQLDRQASDAAGAVVAHVDRPNVSQVMAWQRSEMVFDNEPLAGAVSEMNRYNRTPIVLLDGLASSNLRVSGLYRTSDSAGFANAVAALYGLRVVKQQGRLELAKPY